MKCQTTLFTVLSLVVGATFTLPAVAQDKPGAPLDGTVLPIHEPPVAPITTLDARDAKAPPRFQVKAPQGAPNVVIVPDAGARQDGERRAAL